MSKTSSVKTDKHWFGLPAPKNSQLAWGARAAPRNGQLEFYPDRQQMDDYEHPRKQELKDWINSLALHAFSPGDCLEVDEGDKHLRSELRAGYVCFVAWIDKAKKKKGKSK